MNTTTLVICAGLAAATAAPALGVGIARLSFEDAAVAAQTTSNAGVDPITGEMTAPGLFFAGSANEIGFRTFWTDTRGTGDGGPVDTGNESGDFIGATDFTPVFGVPFTDGVKGYEWNDTDGQIELRLDAVNTAGFGGLTVSFDLFIASTTFEADDSFRTAINGSTVQLLGELDLEGLGGSWQSFAFNVADTTSLDISFFGDNNSGAENIFIDNIVVGGVGGVIPTPGSIALFGAAGLVGLRRRRSA